MPFSITVHRKSDDAFFQSPPSDVASKEFDLWADECQARTLYAEPLGSDGTVYKFWHVPAHALGLSLIGAIYNEGLCMEGDGFGQMEAELNALEEWWKSHAIMDAERLLECSASCADGPCSETQISMEEHLQGRLGCLREAIRIAREYDGIVAIG